MKLIAILICITIFLNSCTDPKRNAMVFMTDYGTKDGAVSSMKGVAHSVDKDIALFDITHEIPAYNIWEAAYRLNQSASYWPAGTVFVSVVDPGVGTERKSIVVETKTGHYFVSPDNGTLTLVADELGITAAREIDETINRRSNSKQSYTFHGRDLYAYAGAKLASGKISFKEIGPLLTVPLRRLSYQKPVFENGVIKGNIPVLDIQYGNVWTNINDTLFKNLQVISGEKLHIVIHNKDSLLYQGVIPFVNTFGDVPEKQPLAYLNSLMNVSFAFNMGNFSDSLQIKSGENWNIQISKAP